MQQQSIHFRQMPPSARTTSVWRRGVTSILRFPLFYKVLIANSLLVVLGAFAGTMLAIRFYSGIHGSGSQLATIFAFIGGVVTITINTIILRAALEPIRALRSTMGSLEQGNLSARIPQSIFADAELANVTDTINGILDRLQRYQDHVSDLSASVLNAQEDERQRISRELHDQIGQSLTLLLIRLKILEALPAANPVHSELEELRGAVASTIDQVRKLALDLRPPALDQLGLVLALRTLTREFSEQTHIAVNCEVSSDSFEVNRECATAAYRIVQEALTNIVKHAHATTANVLIAKGHNVLSLTVQDNGNGFEIVNFQHSQHRSEGPGLGLFGMEERARLLGGTLTIDSQPGIGTVVTATIPTSIMEHSDGSFQSQHAGTNVDNTYPHFIGR